MSSEVRAVLGHRGHEYERKPKFFPLRGEKCFFLVRKKAKNGQSEEY